MNTEELATIAGAETGGLELAQKPTAKGNEMKTILVAEATNIQLDWLVCRAGGGGKLPIWQWIDGRSLRGMFCYTTNWEQGGPIIEREGINLSTNYEDDAFGNVMHIVDWKANYWNVSVPGTTGFFVWEYGPTPLIAAMRCYVRATLGASVEIPKELT